MNELFTLPATELAKRVREKKLSPVELTQAHIDRIEAINPILNAMVEPRFEAALEEAKQAEKRLGSKGEKLPPFFGVPCSIKDTYAVEGMRWCGGAVHRKDLIAEKDASTVARYKKAGAIILGKTNVPEGAMWFETYNKVYGLTRNPYDPDRTVGGSSGGEGALLGAGGAPFGIGSDVGGSIRYPSYFNGIIGHKATGGFIPGTGQWPEADGEIWNYLGYGPMGRSVDDIAQLTRILIGPDGVDPICVKRPFPDYKKFNPKDLTVYYYEDNNLFPTGPEVRIAMRQAVRGLEASGVKTIPWWPRGLKRGLEIWSAMMTLAEGDGYIRKFSGGRPVNLAAEFARFLAGRSEFSLPIMALMLTEPLGKLMNRRNRKLYALGKELQREIEDRLGEDGVLMAPVFPTPAFKHHHAWYLLPGISYSATFNVLELPATMVPVHWTEEGLPVGVQILGKRFADHLTLAMARRLEEIFGGWRIAEPKRKR